MPLRAARLLLVIFVLAAALPPWPSRAQANSDSAYQALRTISLGTQAVSVSNLELKRDSGTFRFRSGTVCFVQPVNGRITGAVFAGDGVFTLAISDENERKSLRYLTKEDEFAEPFERLVLRFTDSTYDEIKKAGSPSTSGCDAGPLKDSQNATRHKLHYNLEARLHAEVLSPEPRPFFYAFIHGRKYDDKEIFEVDPNRNSNQVEFWTYDENKLGDWVSATFLEPHLPGSFGRPVRVEHQQLATTFDKSGALSGKASTSFISLRNGLRVVPLALFPTLRVQNVTADGQGLSFIQEDKNDDPQLSVILSKPLAAGEKFTLVTTYAGKDAVANTGSGNYFPIAREDWYPNSTGSAFGEYATYDMTFRIPKGMKMAATGLLVSDTSTAIRT